MILQRSRFENAQDPRLTGRAILRALGSRCVAMGLPIWTVAQSEQLVRLGDRWFDTGISPLKKPGERFSLTLKHWTRYTLIHSRRRLMGPRDEPLLQSLERMLSMMPSSDAARLVELYDATVTKASAENRRSMKKRSQYRSWGDRILVRGVRARSARISSLSLISTRALRCQKYSNNNSLPISYSLLTLNIIT